MSFSSTGTSFSHNYGIEGEVVGSKPTRCVCNLPKKMIGCVGMGVSQIKYHLDGIYIYIFLWVLQFLYNNLLHHVCMLGGEFLFIVFCYQC
jgi:hypothetical protein